MGPSRQESVPLDQHALADLEGKHVLVTGAGGSIGRALCKVIAQHAASLTLVSISESALFNVRQELKDAKCPIHGVLADCGDQRTMARHLTGINIVIHAAAHKHVPICEENPLAAIRNNVDATQKLVLAAARAGVNQFLSISTDKAVEPISIMGATKRAVELLLTRRNYSPMQVSVVRFGNVLGSDGSVLPLWKKQIAEGGPVTITDRRCTRYFMSVENAVTLILGVLYMKKPGLYVFDMGDPMSIDEILSRLLLNNSVGEGGIEVKEIGLRPGEKLVEELVTGGRLEKTAHPKINKIIEEGKLQPSHQLVPDLVEHAKQGRTEEAVETLWRIVQMANIYED
jgi:FlaA1/EpsC-like NDP-sugar epimerase